MTHETRTITDNLDQLLAILPAELEKRCVVHLNDSKGAAGKHLDRHEHIGEGTIGRDAMRASHASATAQQTVHFGNARSRNHDRRKPDDGAQTARRARVKCKE